MVCLGNSETDDCRHCNALPERMAAALRRQRAYDRDSDAAEKTVPRRNRGPREPARRTRPGRPVTVIELTGAVLPPGADRRLVAMHAYWLGKRGTRRFPSRRDLDPLDVAKLMPHVSIVDVAPAEPRFVYRLFGTAMADLFRRDLTGLPVGTGVLPDQIGAVLARYETVAARGIGLFHRDRLQESANDFTPVERLMLPLGERDDAVDMIVSTVVVPDRA